MIKTLELNSAESNGGQTIALSVVRQAGASVEAEKAAKVTIDEQEQVSAVRNAMQALGIASTKIAAAIQALLHLKD